MLVPKKGQYNIFTAIDKDIHRHKRKMLNQGFSDVNMKKFEPAMLQHIDIFLQNLMTSCDDQGSIWSTPFNMTHCSGHLQYDVMGKFGFGQSFEMQKKPDNHFLLDVVDAICLRGGIYVQYPRLRYLIIDKLLAWRTSVLRSKYAALITSLVQARYAAEKDSQSDLYGTLSDVTNPENGLSFSDEELWAESRFLLIAGKFGAHIFDGSTDNILGADTSRTALSAAFFYLTAYPECYEELIAEIRSTFTSAEEIKSGPKLASCHYLRGCIDEMLRMSCPISGTLWREVCAEGITVDGEHIPASTDIGVNPYAIFHNEKVFPSSSIFMPKRWIVSEDNPQAAVDRARHAFQPFSLGPRSCAGRTMAYMELSNTIAKPCWYMDFKRVEGPMGLVSAGVKGGPKGRDNEKEFQLLEHVTCTHNGPYLQFRLRDGMKKDLVIHGA
jgi:cytochrome P450